jgi:hypothetical protein
VNGVPPRSRPSFRGDDWHELRDAQYAGRLDDLAMLVGEVSDMYLRACVVMGCEDDPVAEALRAGPFFDARSLFVAHARLAAVWRLRHGHVHPTVPGLLDLGPELAQWRAWVVGEVTFWILRRPLLLRRAALVVTRSLVQTPATIVAEMDLRDSLADFYPLPPPDPAGRFEGKPERDGQLES